MSTTDALSELRRKETNSAEKRVDALRALRDSVVGGIFRSDVNSHLYYVNNICIQKGMEICALFDITQAAKDSGGYLNKYEAHKYDSAHHLEILCDLSERVDSSALNEDELNVLKTKLKGAVYESTDFQAAFRQTAPLERA